MLKKNESSSSNSRNLTSNSKHISLIEQRIVMESAAFKIQGLIRCKQAHKRLNILKKDKEASKKEMELLLVTGDLPSNHAMTLRVEGDQYLLNSSSLFSFYNPLLSH